MPTNIALVGIGKIAVDQHVPAIEASGDWGLAATVSRAGRIGGVDTYSDMESMLAARPDIPVVSLCMPPVPRFDYAKAALVAGRHVMLEKPPGATLSECHELRDLAAEKGLSLFATWHSREAATVDQARDWLAEKNVTGAHICWREDVRKWHPGQDWVFEPGGMGVFDPGINALSILTKILPNAVHLQKAKLSYPKNRQTPIAAQLRFSGNTTAELDWRQSGDDVWTIEVETTSGTLALLNGGARMSIGGATTATAPAGALEGEYPRLYSKMAALIERGAIEMDLAPLRHVADAFTLGERLTVEEFHW